MYWEEEGFIGIGDKFLTSKLQREVVPKHWAFPIVRPEHFILNEQIKENIGFCQVPPCEI